MPEFPTSIGTSDPTTIRLLGQDLAADLLGQVGFGELAFWLAARRRPSAGEVRLFEAVLVSLDRPRLHARPRSRPGSRTTARPTRCRAPLAAGMLGGGSRFLGVTEDTGRWLHRVLEGLEEVDGPDRRASGTRSRSRPSAPRVRPATRSPASVTPCTRRPTRASR